jgi:hypothetical protein
MKRHLLLRLYPRAWRERYGEELSAQLEAQRPLRIGIITDLVRGALDAHLHPLRRDNSTMRSSNVIDRRMIAARATAAWSPVAAVAITAVMVLMDFWQGHIIWYRLVGFPKESYVVLFRRRLFAPFLPLRRAVRPRTAPRHACSRSCRRAHLHGCGAQGTSRVGAERLVAGTARSMCQ